MGRTLALAAAALLAWSGTGSAQDPATLVTRGIQAYDALDLAAAAGLLRQALAAPSEVGITPEQRTTALSYLGATEFLRGSTDSAEAAFRRLVTEEPRYVLDEVVFPPEMTALFARVKRDTKVVQPAVPPVARFQAGDPSYRPELIASSSHQIIATVNGSDGMPVRLLFEGLIGDSLELVWDGLTTWGSAVESGRYYLRIESLGQDREPVRVVRVPLDVTVLSVDTLAHPAPPSDSLYLPERMQGGPALEALVGGLVASAGIALLPSVVASDASLSGGRIAVAGTVAIGGVVGYLMQRPGKTIPSNVQHNDRIRQQWRASVDQVAQENARRRDRARMLVSAGPPAVVDLEAP
jgi:hypothetical protein